MFPLPISTYIYAGLILISIICFGYGSYEHNKYVTFKKEVEIAAKMQEEKVKSIEKQHQLVTQGIQDEYNAKLSLLRQYYSNGVHQPSTSTVSNISTTTAISNASAAYAELAGRCSQTTLMLTELQKWILEQVSIK